MKQKEANFSTQRLRAWMKHHIRPPAAVEVKHTRGKSSFPFRELRVPQRSWGKATIGADAKPYKISDLSPGEKPCDYVVFGLMDYWVIIKYPKFFVVIDIEKLLDEEKRSTRKSLTEQRAKVIAEYVVNNK